MSTMQTCRVTCQDRLTSDLRMPIVDVLLCLASPRNSSDKHVFHLKNAHPLTPSTDAPCKHNNKRTLRNRRPQSVRRQLPVPHFRQRRGCVGVRVGNARGSGSAKFLRKRRDALRDARDCRTRRDDRRGVAVSPAVCPWLRVTGCAGGEGRRIKRRA